MRAMLWETSRNSSSAFSRQHITSAFFSRSVRASYHPEDARRGGGSELSPGHGFLRTSCAARPSACASVFPCSLYNPKMYSCVYCILRTEYTYTHLIHLLLGSHAEISHQSCSCWCTVVRRRPSAALVLALAPSSFLLQALRGLGFSVHQSQIPWLYFALSEKVYFLLFWLLVSKSSSYVCISIWHYIAHIASVRSGVHM